MTEWDCIESILLLDDEVVDREPDSHKEDEDEHPLDEASTTPRGRSPIIHEALLNENEVHVSEVIKWDDQLYCSLTLLWI